MIRDITIGQYYPSKSKLHRLDPRVKIMCTLIYLISLFLFQSIGGYIIATMFLAVVIRISKVPFKFIVKGLKPVIMLLMKLIIFVKSPVKSAHMNIIIAIPPIVPIIVAIFFPSE
mgnify:CR=1 FL=1